MSDRRGRPGGAGQRDDDECGAREGRCAGSLMHPVTSYGIPCGRARRRRFRHQLIVTAVGMLSITAPKMRNQMSQIHWREP